MKADAKAISRTSCGRHEASFARATPCKYKHEERDREYADTRPRETCRRYIWRRYCAGATRGASFARSMDHRSAAREEARNQRVGASPRYATLDACECTRASHVQNGLLDARGIWARVRCNKGDNGHYYRRVTFRGTYQSLREIGTRPIPIAR